MINRILGFSIAILPLYLRVTETENNRPSKDFMFYSIATIVVIMAGRKLRSLNAYTKGILLYAVIMAAYLPDHVFSTNVMVHTISMLFGIVFFVKYFEVCDEGDIQPIYDGMMIGSIIQGTIGVGGYFGIEMYHRLMDFAESYPNVYYSLAKERYTLDWIFRDVRATSVGGGPGNVVGSLGNSNLLASYICLTLPAFLTDRTKWFKYLALIPFTALILSESYMGILALIAGAIYYLNYRLQIIHKGWLYLGAIHVMFVAPWWVAPIKHVTFDGGRFYVWKNMLTGLSLSHWIIGRGPGWYPDQRFIMEDGQTALIQEHNSFLTIFNAYGLLGFVLLAPLFYRFIKAKDTNPVVSLVLFIAFCNAYGHFLIQQSTGMLIVIIFLCLGLKEVSSAKNLN